MKYDLSELKAYIKDVEKIISPARHLPADPPGVITGGYGRVRPGLIYEGMIVSEELADQWLEEDLEVIKNQVIVAAPFELTNGQLIALADFVYNEGLGSPNVHNKGLLGSTLFRLVKDKDFSGALAHFLDWDMANGQHLLGLKKRRIVEQNWFVKSE